MFARSAEKEEDACPTVDEMLRDRFIALSNRTGSIPPEDFRILDDTLDCGANGFHTVVWLRQQLHQLQGEIRERDDYLPHADQVKRWALLFDRLARHPNVPRSYVRFHPWWEIDSIDWELQTEVENIVLCDFKCHCAHLN